jgi:hypothetical protein
MAYVRVSPGSSDQSTGRSTVASITYSPSTPRAGSVWVPMPLAAVATRIGRADRFETVVNSSTAG